MLAKVIGDLTAHSLALIADPGHMVAGLVAIGLVMLAMWIAARLVSITHTFRFERTDFLAAVLNALILWLITACIYIDAYRQFIEAPETQGLLMLAVGLGGLVINLAVAWSMHRSAKESLNVEGAPARVGQPARLEGRSDRQRVDRRLRLVHSRLNL